MVGPLLFVLTMASAEMIPLFPTQPLSLASGLLFGPVQVWLCPCPIHALRRGFMLCYAPVMLEKHQHLDQCLTNASWPGNKLNTGSNITAVLAHLKHDGPYIAVLFRLLSDRVYQTGFGDGLLACPQLPQDGHSACLCRALCV